MESIQYNTNYMTITSEDLIKALEKKEVEIVFNAIKNKETGMIQDKFGGTRYNVSLKIQNQKIQKVRINNLRILPLSKINTNENGGKAAFIVANRNCQEKSVNGCDWIHPGNSLLFEIHDKLVDLMINELVSKKTISKSHADKKKFRILEDQQNPNELTTNYIYKIALWQDKVNSKFYEPEIINQQGKKAIGKGNQYKIEKPEDLLSQFKKMGLVVRVGWLKLGDLYCGKLGPSWAFEVYEFVLDDKDKQEKKDIETDISQSMIINEDFAQMFEQIKELNLNENKNKNKDKMQIDLDSTLNLEEIQNSMSQINDQNVLLNLQNDQEDILDE